MAALARLRRILVLPRGQGPRFLRRRRKAAADLRVLLVEDDFASRLLLQTFLSRYGECHIAVNGREAVEAFRSAWSEAKIRSDLHGHHDARNGRPRGGSAARALEEARGILSTSGAKIIMTTAVDDMKEVIRCFQELCDAYLMKPIDLAQLLSHMRSFNANGAAETPIGSVRKRMADVRASGINGKCANR
jgi:two-component system, chemotaxis family, chemotaxis protein CheY